MSKKYIFEDFNSFSGIVKPNLLKRIQILYFNNFDVVEIEALKDAFQVYHLRDLEKVNKKMPLLLFINQNIINELKLQGKLEGFNLINAFDKEKSSNKYLFLKALGKKKYLPNYVFKKETIKDTLKYPIIIKPYIGESAEGIFKVRNEEQLKEIIKENPNDYIFQEYLKIKSEFRVLIYNDIPIRYIERIKEKEFNNEDKITFNYKYCLIEELYSTPYFTKVKEIIQDIKNSIQLDFFMIDFAIDENKNLYVFEINTLPGLCNDSWIDVYAQMFKHFYPKEYDLKYFNSLRRKYITYDTYKTIQMSRSYYDSIFNPNE